MCSDGTSLAAIKLTVYTSDSALKTTRFCGKIQLTQATPNYQEFQLFEVP